MCAMTNNVRTILTPLFIISFVFGSRIVEFSTSRRKVCFCVIYISLLWSIYFFFLIRIVLTCISKWNIDYIIVLNINTFISLMSVIFGVHYNKKLIRCLNKITIVDDTLEQLGIKTDYQKLRTKILWLALGFFVMAILMMYQEFAWLRHDNNFTIMIASCVIFVFYYCRHIDFINDLIIVSILGYIGLKFDQINENLQKLINKCEIRQSWIDHALHSRQRRHLRTPSNIYMTWIVIHLHLELRKISHEINSIFGMQMTLKMGLYFGLLASGLRVIFSILKNTVNNKTHFFVIMLSWEVVLAFQVLLINYMCEKVSAKANTIGSFMNKISYSTCEIEIRENITQLLLQVIQSPLRFYGIGLFQFGFKFLYKITASIATVVVILLQEHVNGHF